MTARRQKTAIFAALIAFCLGVVVTRAVWEGRSALEEAGTAVSAGDLREGIALYRRAARWYVPGAPHVGRAYDRLEALGAEAQARGELELALAAWRGVRGSILATRSFFTPHAERLGPANRKIAALMAQTEGPDADPKASAAEREAWHLRLLERDEAPSVFWSVVALLGFSLWLGGGFLFALRGVTDDDRLAPRPAAVAGGLVAFGLVVWMLGLYLA